MSDKPTIKLDLPHDYWKRHRRLEEGEVIRASDECLTDSHRGWRLANPDTVGQRAPDPSYTAHRIYRRLKD